MIQLINVYETPNWAKFISASRLSDLSEDLHEQLKRQLNTDTSSSAQSLIGDKYRGKPLLIGIVEAGDFIANQIRKGCNADAACSEWKKVTTAVLKLHRADRKNIKLFDITKALTNPKDFCNVVEAAPALKIFEAHNLENDLFSIASNHLVKMDDELYNLNLLLRASALPIAEKANQKENPKTAIDYLTQIVKKQTEKEDDLKLVLSQLFYTQEQLEIYFHQSAEEERKKTRYLNLLTDLRVRLTTAEYEQKVLQDSIARIRKSRSWRFSKLFRVLERLISRFDESGHNELTRQARLLASSKYFDSDWYLETYQDVASARANPIEHYLHFGAREGRSPGPLFDASWYLQQYPDVQQHGTNPLLHYIMFGESEGREIKALPATTN